MYDSCYCRRPQGTGFLTFDNPVAADAAISAANAESGLGIIIKGRPLKVLKALDKESVHKKELEKLKNEVHDRRNLYLAKVWFFLDLSYLIKFFDMGYLKNSSSIL